MKLLSKPEYLEHLDSTRDERMSWWREARFGMFVHLGLYSVLQRHEWAFAFEDWQVDEYEKLAAGFKIEKDAASEWAKLAKAAGMKYMVLTTRHHEGFSLWDSKINPFNSMNCGLGRDIVREFVDACRAEGLRIGFYSSLMDWRHPDGGRSAYDSAARKRFQDYIYALNEELLTNYGKIDILWYDVAHPMESHEGWNSLEINQRLRALQPDIIINDRSLLPEDFGTPEENLIAEKRDWEACMTFNGISWGYLDSAQVLPYSYNANTIIKMLNSVCAGGGNLLLNIGPDAQGQIPKEAIEPLKTVGRWLAKNGDCVYGKLQRVMRYSSGVCSCSIKGSTLYVWNWIWPHDGELILGGFKSKLKSAQLLESGMPIECEQKGWRIFLRNLPNTIPDKEVGITVLVLDFENDVEYEHFPGTPALNRGKINEYAN